MSETDRLGDIKPESDVNDREDITYAPYLKSTKFNRMPKIMRAAQFAPFAALSGHSAVMCEVARKTYARKELDIQKKEEINFNLILAREELLRDKKVFANIIFFKEDEKKSGGEYINEGGYIEYIDERRRSVVFTDGRIVPIPDIIEFII